MSPGNTTELRLHMFPDINAQRSLCKTFASWDLLVANEMDALVGHKRGTAFHFSANIQSVLNRSRQANRNCKLAHLFGFFNRFLGENPMTSEDFLSRKEILTQIPRSSGGLTSSKCGNRFSFSFAI